jgi:Ca2+/Na+ antiporter
MAAASVLVFIMARDGFLDRVEGVVLFVPSVGYTLAILRTSRKESAQLRAEFSTKYAAPEPAEKASRLVLNLIYLLGGIAIIVVGRRSPCRWSGHRCTLRSSSDSRSCSLRPWLKCLPRCSKEI